MNRRIAARAWLCEIVSPFVDPQPDLPDETLWVDVLEAADSALLLPRLWHEIEARADALPVAVAELLAAVDALNQDRNARMRRQTCEVIALLNAVDVEPVILKGNALLMSGQLKARARMVNDIDVWVAEEKRQTAAIAALERAGYATKQPVAGFRKADSHHFPPFFIDGGAGRVELHHALIRPALRGLMDEDAAARRLERVEAKGLRYRLLHRDDALSLSYIQSTHMAVPGFETARVPLMKWVDFVDRVAETDKPAIASRADCGLVGPDTATDVQFLTALSVYFSMPYAGPRDLGYVENRNARLAGRWIWIMLRGLVSAPPAARSLHPSRWANWPRILRNRYREYSGTKGL